MAVKTGAEHPEVPAHKNVPKTAANYEHVAAMEALEKLAERVREAGRIMDEMARLLMRSKDDQRDLRMRQLLDLEYVLDLVTEVFEGEGATMWLHARNRQLDGERPLDLIARNETDRVIALLDRLADGNF